MHACTHTDAKIAPVCCQLQALGTDLQRLNLTTLFSCLICLCLSPHFFSPLLFCCIFVSVSPLSPSPFPLSVIPACCSHCHHLILSVCSSTPLLDLSCSAPSHTILNSVWPVVPYGFTVPQLITVTRAEACIWYSSEKE